jgi:hypothetical protein
MTTGDGNSGGRPSNVTQHYALLRSRFMEDPYAAEQQGQRHPSGYGKRGSELRTLLTNFTGEVDNHESMSSRFPG